MQTPWEQQSAWAPKRQGAALQLHFNNVSNWPERVHADLSRKRRALRTRNSQQILRARKKRYRAIQWLDLSVCRRRNCFFHFKDEYIPELSTESLATACIRDLFEEAAAIEESLPPETNPYFKQGSFAKGTMRFIRTRRRPCPGRNSIDWIRSFAFTHRRQKSSGSYFFGEASEQTAGLAFIFDHKENLLKGFKEQSLICRAREFNSIDWIFEQENWAQLAYFRQDRHLLYVLKKIR